jgi:protocatechuate 3,4-dioxygenase, alpha subunit
MTARPLPPAGAVPGLLRAIADPGRRGTLIAVAQPGPPGGFRFDIRLQGEQETVFFDV